MILAKVAQTYRDAPALVDTVTLKRTKLAASTMSHLDLAFGFGTEARVRHDEYQFTAAGESVFITREGVGEKFFRTQRVGNLDETLTQTPGGFGHAPVPHFALRYGKDGDDPAQAFNLRLPMVLKLASYRRSETDGQQLDEISFVARAGDATAYIDPAINLVKRVRVRIVPPGSTSESLVLDARFDPRILKELPEPIAFDSTGRHEAPRVNQLARFEGESIADAQLVTPEGQTINLADLRGSVVVLYFWTTRCQACLKAMDELDELTKFLMASGQQVKFYAVLCHDGDTLEERRQKAAAVWTNSHHLFPAVIDARDTLADPMAIATTRRVVVLRPDLTISKILEDTGAGLTESLKEQIAVAQGSPASRPPAKD